jgi:hypothetical protein
MANELARSCLFATTNIAAKSNVEFETKASNSSLFSAIRSRLAAAAAGSQKVFLCFFLCLFLSFCSLPCSSFFAYHPLQISPHLFLHSIDAKYLGTASDLRDPKRWMTNRSPQSDRYFGQWLERCSWRMVGLVSHVDDSIELFFCFREMKIILLSANLWVRECEIQVSHIQCYLNWLKICVWNIVSCCCLSPPEREDFSISHNNNNCRWSYQTHPASSNPTMQMFRSIGFELHFCTMNRINENMLQFEL